MSPVGKFSRVYFNSVYNPLYDATTARFSRYQQLQQHCLAGLHLHRARNLLCVGLGTGNEAVAALKAFPDLAVAGVDLSSSALRSARRKLRGIGKRADLRLQSAEALPFSDHAFDAALCMHVLDFVDHADRVVDEVVRVLRPGGRFVVTFPSRADGTAMGLALAADHVASSLRAGRHSLAVVAELIARITIGVVYVPLLARGGRLSFEKEQLRALLDGLPVHGVSIEEERAYQDFIVTGQKK